MCGILGAVAQAGSRVNIEPEQFKRMRDRMETRGPDGSGTFRNRNVLFGHRRLAIRDKTGGHQPWVSDDGQIVLVYNGELYNDAQLRDELTSAGYTFRSYCDTEVILASYREWGAQCIKRFRGMFALGIYDFREESLLLARDRFGIKPLFFTEMGSSLLFSSSIAALLNDPSFSKRPNLKAISHYLTTLRITLGRETVFENLFQLLPGEFATWRSGVLTIGRYWDYPTSIDEDLPYDEAARELRTLLADAVSCRLVSDVPVGMFLSGGVDSNTIACLIKEVEPQRMIGTCGGGESDTGDFQHARRCAQHVQFDYDEVHVSADNYLNTWQHLVEQYETPVSTPSDVIIHQLAHRMRQSVGVALGGEGADELLCGYGIQHWAGNDFEASRALSQESSESSPTASEFRESLIQQYGRDQFASEVDHYFALNSLIPTNAKPLLLNDWAWQQTEQDVPMWMAYDRQFAALGSLPTAEKHARLLHRVNLESLLSRLDSATMLASLEARVPFTDHPLVERMFQISPRFKINVDQTETHPHLSSGELEARGSLNSKRLLRTVARNLMPSELSERKKASFPTPVKHWLAGQWADRSRSYLRGSPFANWLFQKEAISQLSDNPASAGMWAWPLLNLAQWGDRQF